jgi:hypothetical protein
VTGLSGRPDKTARIHEKVAVRKTFGRSRVSAGLSFWGFEEDYAHGARSPKYSSVEYEKRKPPTYGVISDTTPSASERRYSVSMV